MRWINTVGAIALGAIFMHTAGCTLPGWLSRSTSPSGQTTPAEGASGLTVTALPVYRLVTSPTLVDLPARLFVIEVRLAATDAALSVTLDDFTLVLPSGEHGHIFDRARALELVRRATLADADLSYMRNGGHVPGGVSEYAREPLRDAVIANLLTEGAITADQPMVGFVVADTGVPLLSLDGASLEVVAHRLRDAAPAQAVYRFSSPPAADAEAPPP